MIDENNLPEWFNIDEFNTFLAEELGLNEEVSVQTRIKLARAAKRTSKRRAFLRKSRSKKRKNVKQLKQRAFKAVRSALRNRLFSGNLKKASYSQRARIDAIINKRKKFVNNLVSQIMPKVVKGESERLAKLTSRKPVRESVEINEEEKTNMEKRVSARKRKQAQREREAKVRAADPSQLAMVVRDENNHLIIVDKNSFESDKHTPVVKPQDMSYSVALRVSQDPGFKNTVTSERILGEKITKKEETPKTQQDTGDKSTSPMPVAQQQQDIGMASTPIPDTTPVDSVTAKWAPLVALNVMKGIDLKEQIKRGMITKEQANEFMFSQNIQDFSNTIIKNLARQFMIATGRDINEYEMVSVLPNPMPVTELWREFNSTNNYPKTDVMFLHRCRAQDGTEGGCDSWGVSPEEQVIKVNIKYGKSVFANGKMSGDIRALFESVSQKIQRLLLGEPGSVLGFENNISESDRIALEDIQKEIKGFNSYIHNCMKKIQNPMSMTTLHSRAPQNMKELIEEYADKIEEIKVQAQERLKEIFSGNRIASKLFYHESLTGKLKFGDQVGTADFLMSINPESLDVKFNKMDEQFIDELVDTEEMQLFINFDCNHCGTSIEENAFQKTINDYNEAAKPLPEQIEPIRFCGRQLNSVKKEAFRNSVLKNLFEQTPMDDLENNRPINPSDEFNSVYMKNYLAGLQDYALSAKTFEQQAIVMFNAFKNEPVGVHTNPVELYQMNHNRDGIKTTPITVNGKQKMINVMNIAVFNSDEVHGIEDMSESYSFAKRFLAEKKKRNYKREYATFHGKPERIKERAARVKARRMLEREGRVHKGDGKDIDHKNGNPRDNSRKNLRVVSKSINRAKK